MTVKWDFPQEAFDFESDGFLIEARFGDETVSDVYTVTGQYRDYSLQRFRSEWTFRISTAKIMELARDSKMIAEVPISVSFVRDWDSTDAESFAPATILVETPESALVFSSPVFKDDYFSTDSVHIFFRSLQPWHFPEAVTCSLFGEASATDTLDFGWLLDRIRENENEFFCYFSDFGSRQGMSVSGSVTATNRYGVSPIAASETRELVDYVPNPERAPEPTCPQPLRINELTAEEGACGGLVVEVFQSDLNTGPCTFLGNWTQENGDSAVGLFHYCDVYREGAFAEGSSYSVNALLIGSTTYVAQIGGQRTVLEFDLVK